MRGTPVLLLVTLLAIIQLSVGLTCGRCDKSKCRVPSCPFGAELDPCGCCLRCLKVTGERCGGSWYRKGKCVEGLVCENDPDRSGGTCVNPTTEGASP